MNKTNLLLIPLLLLLGWLAISASKPKKKEFNGEWRIKTVLVGEDTLYVDDDLNYTARCISSALGAVETEEDKKYVWRCIRSTYFGFKQSRLTIKNDSYRLNVLPPCWDHFRILNIKDGVCLQNENSIIFYKEIDLVMTNLSSDEGENHLVYENQELEHKIVFSRLAEK